MVHSRHVLDSQCSHQGVHSYSICAQQLCTTTLDVHFDTSRKWDLEPKEIMDAIREAQSKEL